MASIRQLYVNLSLRAADFNNQIRGAQREMKEFERIIRPSTKALNDIGRTATAAGGALTAGVTVPLTALAAVSVKAASEFESSFAGIRKTVDGVVDSGGGLTEFGKELSQQMRDLSKTIPISVNELNKIGEAAGQLGIKKDSIVEFTKTMAMLGETTNLTSDQAATATANIQNIFGAAGKDVDRFGATLVALGNAGASTEADIIEMGKRIAGTGHLVGLTQAQVLSFASALSSVGINAEAGGSAISRVFLKINNAVADGGKSLDEFARIAGMNSAAFKQAFQTDAAGATVAFISGLQRLKGEGENVNATIEGVIGKSIIIKDTLLRASGAGDLLTSTLQLGNRAWQENSALIKEAEQRHATFKSQLQLLWNVVNDVAITLGTVLIPILLNVLSGLKPVIAVVAQLAEWFAKLPVPVQTVIVAIGALAAIVGPLLLAFGLAATSIAAVIPAVLGAAAAIGTVGAPVLALVAAIGIWIAGLTAAGVALAAFIASNEKTRAAVVEAWEIIQLAALRLFDQLVPLFSDIAAKMSVVWAAIGPDVQAAFSFAVSTAAEMIKNLAVAIEIGLDFITGLVELFHGTITGDFSKIKFGVTGIWNATWDAVKAIVLAPIGFIKLTVTVFLESIKAAFSTLKTNTEKIWSAMWNAIKSAMMVPINAIKATIADLTGAVTGRFKAMYDAVVGNSYVPDMIEGIRDAFGQLDEVMVDPTRRAANGVMSSFKNMFDTVLGFARDWKGSLKSLLGDILQGFDLKAILKGDFGSILGSLKDVLGIGGGKSGSGGIGGALGGIFGGGTGAGQAATGAMATLNPIAAGVSIAQGAFNLGKDIAGEFRKGAKQADALVPAQVGFGDALSHIIDPINLARKNDTLTLSQAATGQIVLEQTISEYLARLNAFASAPGEDQRHRQLVVDQSLRDMTPLITQLRLDIQKAIQEEGGIVGRQGEVIGGGGTTITVEAIHNTFYLDGVTDVPTLIEWIKLNFGGLTEEIVRQVELKTGAVVSR